jgi:hypothetical protein
VISVVLGGLKMGESHADSIAEVLASSDPARLLYGRYGCSRRDQTICVDGDNEGTHGGAGYGDNGVDEMNDGIPLRILGTFQ